MGYEDTLAAFRRGDNAEAERLALADLEAAAAAGDRAGQVDALCMLARVALRDGRLDDVEAKSLAAHQSAGGEVRLQRMPLHLRAVAARMANRHDEARDLYRQSIRLNAELGEMRMAAAEHRNLAYVELRAGDLDEARRLFAESRRLFAGLDAPSMAPYLTFDEATVAALDGDAVTARTKLSAAESLFAAQGVAPDPDDAVEITDLRRRLDAQPNG
ncbi:MAG TPA: tetratricopeptide repeat protein [Mycobacteriales bacterium]|nr:tetratricopeptide repeat protein [Mycobacteriales bacterium]